MKKAMILVLVLLVSLTFICSNSWAVPSYPAHPVKKVKAELKGFIGGKSASARPITQPDVWFSWWEEYNEQQERIVYIFVFIENLGFNYWANLRMNGEGMGTILPQRFIPAPNAPLEVKETIDIQYSFPLKSQGRYLMEARVYVSLNSYFLFEEELDIPAFDAWTYNIYCGPDEVTIKYELIPYFVDLKDGDLIEIYVNEEYFESTIYTQTSYYDYNYVDYFTDIIMSRGEYDLLSEMGSVPTEFVIKKPPYEYYFKNEYSYYWSCPVQ